MSSSAYGESPLLNCTPKSFCSASLKNRGGRGSLEADLDIDELKSFHGDDTTLITEGDSNTVGGLVSSQLRSFTLASRGESDSRIQESTGCEALNRIVDTKHSHSVPTMLPSSTLQRALMSRSQECIRGLLQNQDSDDQNVRMVREQYGLKRWREYAVLR